MSKKVYLAGAISNDPNYKEKFDNAEKKLEDLGFKVINPTKIPYDLEYDDYFPICYSLIDISDYIVVLDYSKGVAKELNYNRNKKEKIKLKNGTSFTKINIKPVHGYYDFLELVKESAKNED